VKYQKGDKCAENNQTTPKPTTPKKKPPNTKASLETCQQRAQTQWEIDQAYYPKSVAHPSKILTQDPA
jgi:hypothetical protein